MKGGMATEASSQDHQEQLMIHKRDLANSNLGTNLAH